MKLRIPSAIAMALAVAFASIPARAGPPTMLSVATSGGDPTINAPFDLVIRSHDGAQFVPVSANTTVSLTKSLGSGTLTGLSPCVIPAGTSSCTLGGLTYSAVGMVGLDAGVTSGDALAPYHYQFSVQRATPAVVITSNTPSPVGQASTFSATVTGVAPTGNVLFRTSASVICPAVPLAGTGNSRTASCSTSALPAGTHLVDALYEGDAQNMPTGAGGFPHFVYAPSTNVALAANGGVATASSTIVIAGANFDVASVNDGVHTGTWGSGGGWNDATGNAFPDWVQVRFNASKTIDKVVVTTLQDNYASPVVPTDTTTFTKYGITAFQVQTWTGSAWVTRATVTGNTAVKRTVTFPAVATDRVRILVTGALASYSRILEIEAWTSGPSPTTIALASAWGFTVYPDAVALTATVAGNAPTGTVTIQRLGSPVCAATLTAGRAECVVPYLTPGEHVFSAIYDGDSRNFGSASAPLTHTILSGAGSNNVAHVNHGGVPTASSTLTGAGSNYGVAGVNDGVRNAAQWGKGGGWSDGTSNAFPDWVQIAFDGVRTIDRAIVVTLRDDPPSPADPGDVETFTKWGVTAFQVQTWNGSAWTTRATVTGNALIKRAVTFPPVATDRIRLLVTGALGSYSRVVELEAWTRDDTATATTLSSSSTPAIAGAPVTFTATVTNATNVGHVSFFGPGELCSVVPLAAGRASCTVVLPSGTYPISALYSGSPGALPSSSATLALDVVVALPSTNVALAANGGVATASSTIVIAGANFDVASVNDGVHTGTWGSGGGWNDATGNAFPDWVQVRFNASKTIDKVVVTTLQDNYASPVVPTDTTTFTKYGITAFQVQTWTGSAWVTRATVTGNTAVKRTVTFPAVATDRVRILVTGALASYSRILEIEAWTSAGSALAGKAAVDGVLKAPAEATPIPALGLPALGLISLLVAALGIRARARRR